MCSYSSILSLILQGSSLRRTNETDMNAQSSRSHAIFSLTLTQRKFTGSGPPPRSSSPMPPNGRSPSKLSRPGSMLPGASSRLSMPMSSSRPGTPSFSRGPGLRPASALGTHGMDRSEDQSGEGEWTTIVSKFHFVDLAGSERVSANRSGTAFFGLTRSTAQTHRRTRRACEGGHFHQQRSACTWQRHLSPR
jgi:hypothetical protein